MRINLRHLLMAFGPAAGLSIFMPAGSGEFAAADSSPYQMIDISLQDLAKSELAPIQDRPYWKVVGSERPLASSFNGFISNDGKFDAGVGQYHRVTLELHDWPADTFMYILEGKVEITDGAGHVRVYGPGDAFVMPKGFKGTWRQLSDIKKIHVSYDSTPK